MGQVLKDEKITATRIEAYVTSLRKWAHFYQYNPYRLAKDMGVSPGYLRNMFKDNWNPTYETLRLIEQFIQNYPRFAAQVAAQAAENIPTTPQRSARETETTSGSPSRQHRVAGRKSRRS